MLRHYNNASVRGFDGELVSQTLKYLDQAFKARGNKPRVYNDYEPAELDVSWRMAKVAEDIRWALKPDQTILPYHMAEILTGLGSVGYKNTKLIPEAF